MGRKKKTNKSEPVQQSGYIPVGYTAPIPSRKGKGAQQKKPSPVKEAKVEENKIEPNNKATRTSSGGEPSSSNVSVSKQSENSWDSHTSERYSKVEKPGHSGNEKPDKMRREQCEKEFWKFEELLRKNKKNASIGSRINELEGQDLFTMPEEYALAHCVAEDMSMGSGIAVTFRQNFKQVDKLLDQHQKTGGLAVLKTDKDKRFIYYLVTKKQSIGKPYYVDLFTSLLRLRQHMTKNDVKKLAIPRIGCGLDRLEWTKVKPMLEYVFKDTDIEIVVCNFQQDEEHQPPKSRKCRIVDVDYKLDAIKAMTLIVYFGYEDDRILTDEMRALNSKFRIAIDYSSQRKSIGQVIISKNVPNYVLFGCIVRKTKNDQFSFSALQKCMYEVNSKNKELQYEYVGVSKLIDDDDVLTEKVLNIMKHTLRFVHIYVCLPINEGEKDSKKTSATY